MLDFTENVCGSKKKPNGPSFKTSIISKGKVVLEISDGSSFSTLQLIWRYGALSLWRMSNYVKNQLKQFNTIYHHLDKGNTYERIVDLLEEMFNPKYVQSMLSHSLFDVLHSHGVNYKLINELCRVATRVNYGQLPQNIHSFVGSISIAGTQGGLWAVENGNYKIPECL